VPAYTVSYYAALSGEQPVKKFLSKLNAKARSKCYEYVDMLKGHGLSLQRSHLAKVESGLWELRPEWQGVEYRLLFTSHENRFIMVHALVKKSDKLKPRDIETARRRAREVAEYYASFTNR